ncbi:MAG: hypothetical protein JXB60_07925, partial [Candidatus Cloacimonetes bacterium]|nr:hypothetical protein [Candidatus Cloacimonadota bacterium]
MKLFQRAVIFITILLAVYTILIFILFTNISSFLDFVNVIAIMAVLACLVAILYSSLYLIPLEKAVKIIKNIASGNYARPKKSRQRLFRPVFQDLDSIIEKLELYEQKLTKRKEGFYAVIDSIQEAIWIQDRKGLIRTANESFEKLVQQQNLKNLYFWNVIRSKELYDFVDSIHKQPASSRKEISCAEHYYMCSASILSVTGEILFILYDITEIKKLEILKKDLILNVSHELRTPLTSIKGYLETLEAESDKKMLPYLEIIKRNTDRLINIIR